jgi:integrase
MTPRRQHMRTALPLSGQGERTPQASVREGRLLAQCYSTSPDVIAAKALQASFLHCTNVDGLAPASRRISSRAIRCCSPHVLQRDWHPLTLMRAHSARLLPAVLRVAEGRWLLAAAPPLHTQVSCTPVSSVGRRLPAARSLQGSDLDGPRLQGHVPRGQGAQDRDVPLPAATLTLLRTSWHTHRHPTWRLPAPGREHQHSPTALSPLRRARVPGACRTAHHRARLPQLGGAIQPLRPAYAPRLLAAGG